MLVFVNGFLLASRKYWARLVFCEFFLLHKTRAKLTDIARDYGTFALAYWPKRKWKKKKPRKKKKHWLTSCTVVGSLIHVAVRDAPRRRRKGRLGHDVCPPEVPNEVLHLGEASDHKSGFPLGNQSVKVHGENCKWQIANRHHFPY